VAHPAHTSTPPRRLAEVWSRLAHIYQKEIWQASHLRDRSPKGRCFAVLRVISITVTVCLETRIASRAAALSFSSLLGLGPLVAIAVLVAGFALGKNDPNLVANTLSGIIKFVAPQLKQYEELTNSPTAVDPTLIDTINNIIKTSQSGSVGALGVFSLLLIVLMMFKGIEDTFNDIWGVRQGRTVLMRVVLYWTVLTLGAVLFFTAVALLSAGTFVSVFREVLPGGLALLQSLSWFLPAFSFVLLAALLALFYRVIPNTRVFWRPAVIGALVVTALLALNNFAAFLYIKRVVLDKNLYGSLALPLVFMSVLYIFWLCVLIGGIVSYAIQNIHFRNSQAAWSTLAESMRERLSLVVFLTICRRFRDCLPPISASDLGTLLKVPTQLLNECLNRLVHLKLVTAGRPADETGPPDNLYQPARPLNRITLFDFKTMDDNFGENPISSSLDQIDPLLSHYDAALNRLGEQEFFQKNLEQLFEDHNFKESHPPFALGARRLKPTGGANQP
jgi:membrane protein